MPRKRPKPAKKPPRKRAKPAVPVQSTPTTPATEPLEGMAPNRARTLLGQWRQPFLAALSRTGIIMLACQAAGINRKTQYDHRQSDPEFAAAFASALEEGGERLEAEGYRRGVQGWDEPVYWRGKVVGSVKRYSDRCLMKLMDGAMPGKYRDRKLEHTGGILVVTEEVIDGSAPKNNPSAPGPSGFSA